MAHKPHGTRSMKLSLNLAIIPRLTTLPAQQLSFNLHMAGFGSKSDLILSAEFSGTLNVFMSFCETHGVLSRRTSSAEHLEKISPSFHSLPCKHVGTWGEHRVLIFHLRMRHSLSFDSAVIQTWHTHYWNARQPIKIRQKHDRFSSRKRQVTDNIQTVIADS